VRLFVPPGVFRSIGDSWLLARCAALMRERAKLLEERGLLTPGESEEDVLAIQGQSPRRRAGTTPPQTATSEVTTSVAVSTSSLSAPPGES